MNINQVIIAGNVVTQPVFDHVGPAETPKCSFRFAQTERRRDALGNWQDGETTFINVTCWRTVAENAYASVHRGDGLLLAGKLSYDEWEKDGQRRSRHQLDAIAVGVDLSRQIVTVKKAKRTSPDTAAPSDGSTYGDGSTDAVASPPLSDTDLAALDALGELDELDELEVGLTARV
ncbi:MAG: single-strand DNA-binding protein [Frankiaceae bacterium]|jgi:single-strand DNA-binding protein|nr:single-strand DNA-binding protein [Frankiaceae bacterium]